MSKDLKETVNPPRSPDEAAFWMYHVGNTQKWEHPQGNESSFSPEMSSGNRPADNTVLDDGLSMPFITDADWVDELLADVKNVMRHYYSPGYPGEFDPSSTENGAYYDDVLGEEKAEWARNLWSFWNESEVSDIAEAIEKSSEEELADLVEGINPRDARRMLSGAKLVEFNAAFRALKKLKKLASQKKEISEAIKLPANVMKRINDKNIRNEISDILTSHKTKDHYEETWQYISDEFPDLDPDEIDEFLDLVAKKSFGYKSFDAMVAKGKKTGTL